VLLHQARQRLRLGRAQAVAAPQGRRQPLPPGGVGAGLDPPVFLAPGQVVRTVIEGIGELENPCVGERES